MRYVAMIGDLVKSRHSSDRGQVQRQLEQVVRELNARAVHLGLVSPLTITLGDEFQALFGRAEHLWWSVLSIEAALQPLGVRFSLGVGTLDTPVNTRVALGMDGPAFHRARHGLDELKPTARRYRVVGTGFEDALLNHALDLFCHQRNKWRENRLHILVGHMQGERVDDMARQLGISEQAVYRNITDGALDTITGLLASSAGLIDRALMAHPQPIECP